MDLGPGVYPKADAPQPPFHPHCYCLLSPVVNLINPQPKFNPNAERTFLRTLPAKEAAQVAGSFEKRRRILEDKETMEGIYNQGKDPLYQWKRVGDFMEKNVVESVAGKKKPRVAVLDQVDPTTADGVKTIFERLANNNPDWFPHGVKTVNFADLDPGVVASTDQAGGFDFSRLPLKELQNQSPADVAQRALKRIQDKKALNRQDEEVLRTMWHEIRHNMQPPFDGKGKERLVMETIHEAVTRHTFDRFAKELGFTPQHDQGDSSERIGLSARGEALSLHR
jgi:hypothetical protein